MQFYDEDHDGYSNEYQRASDAARIENPPQDETKAAHRLTLAGKTVLLEIRPYYCRVTSAILDQEVLIEGVYETEDAACEAQARAFEYAGGLDSEVSFVIYRVPPPQPPKPEFPSVPDFDDEIPF